ncbi:MAG TPA: sigma-70 factor domain-containing protein, partial [Streptosporangiaceae bacterium]|nr:sigma-70 factor domain-containing protein [Streptosporangiaceae bacterium]
MVVSAADSAARKRPRTGQQPGAVEEQAVQAAGQPSDPEPGNPEEDGSEVRADADVSLAAVDLDDDDAVDLDSFDDLDDADVDIQAALAEGELEEPDLADVVAVADDIVGDDVDVEGPDGIDALDALAGVEPDRGAADADAEADGPEGSEGPDAAGASVVKIAPEGGEQDEEIFVFGDDDDDLPAAQVAVAGATADPVKDYLKQIGKVPLLNAEQEVELATRIEAGLFAEEKLAEGRLTLSTDARIDLEWIA